MALIATEATSNRYRARYRLFDDLQLTYRRYIFQGMLQIRKGQRQCHSVPGVDAQNIAFLLGSYSPGLCAQVLSYLLQTIPYQVGSRYKNWLQQRCTQ